MSLVRARMSVAAAVSTIVLIIAAVCTAAPAVAVAANRSAEAAHATTSHPKCPSKAQFGRWERQQDPNANAHRVTQRECVRRWAALTVTDGHGNVFPSLFHYTDAHQWKWRDRFDKKVCRQVPRRIHWVCEGS